MSELTSGVWKILKTAALQVNKRNDKIVFNDEKEGDFARLFNEKYDFVKKTFMKESVDYLDRHKVTSIIIASAIEVDIVTYTEELPQGQEFLGKYFVAASSGLNYMLDRLNKLLIQKNQNTINEFWFPPAFSCKTPYFQIFARNLYFTDKFTDWKFNLLDMSEILFLLEYMTLEKNGIDPEILIEKEES